jgi:anti-sigma B factor antagonist
MSNFKIDIVEKNNIHVVNLKGHLDAHTAGDLERVLQTLADEKKYKVIVNFKDLSFICSAGLGVFMAYIEDFRKSQGDIKLSNMSNKIYNVFDLIGLPLLFDITKDDAEAISKF